MRLLHRHHLAEDNSSVLSGWIVSFPFLPLFQYVQDASPKSPEQQTLNRTRYNSNPDEPLSFLVTSKVETLESFAISWLLPITAALIDSRRSEATFMMPLNTVCKYSTLYRLRCTQHLATYRRPATQQLPSPYFVAQIIYCGRGRPKPIPMHGILSTRISWTIQVYRLIFHIGALISVSRLL